MNSCAANLPININFRVPLSPLNLDYILSFVDGGGGRKFSMVPKFTKVPSDIERKGTWKVTKISQILPCVN